MEYGGGKESSTYLEQANALQTAAAPETGTSGRGIWSSQRTLLTSGAILFGLYLLFFRQPARVGAYF